MDYWLRLAQVMGNHRGSFSVRAILFSIARQFLNRVGAIGQAVNQLCAGGQCLEDANRGIERLPRFFHLIKRFPPVAQ